MSRSQPNRARDIPAVLFVTAMALFLLVTVNPVAGQAPAAARANSSSASAARTPTQAAAATAKFPAPGQFPPYKAPRTPDGKPDLNGIWQAFVKADIDVQDHDAQAGPHPDIMGAYGAWPGGQGIVEGGEIPYKPEAL